MISSIECKDFRKEYTDEFNCSRKVRNEACNHYEINMKLLSSKGKFQKYKIRFTCKGCQEESEEEFNYNSRTFQYECIKCHYPKIEFRYINTLEDQTTPEDIKKSKREYIEENNSFKNEINKFDREYINNQVRGNQENHKWKYYNTPEQKLYKTFKTPDDFSQKEEFHNDLNNKQKKKEYQTPNYLNKDCAPVCYENNNIKSKSDVNTKTKIKFNFKDSINQVELDPYIPIDEQYSIIQDKLNFKDKKKIYFNGVELNLKKPFSEIKKFDKFVFEVED